MIDSIGIECNPTDGIFNIPFSGTYNCHTQEVRLREILAENFKALLARRPGLDTLAKITAATNKRLSNGKLDRIRRAAAATDIDTLEDLAQVFGIQPAELLLPIGQQPPRSAKVDARSALDLVRDRLDALPLHDRVQVAAMLRLFADDTSQIEAAIAALDRPPTRIAVGELAPVTRSEIRKA